MNQPLELVYESMYRRAPLNEKFLGIGGKSMREVYNIVKQVIHDTYGEDVMDIILNDTKVDDAKRVLYDQIKQSDLDDTIKVRIINKISKAHDMCSLFNFVTMGARI